MQDVYGAPSSAHSNVEPDSELEKAKDAVVCVVVLAGPLPIVVSGASGSRGGTATVTVHACVAGVASVFPAASVARTLKTWLPTATLAYTAGLVQDVNDAPSRAHSNADPPSELAKVKLAVVTVVVLAGPLAIVVSGASRSAGGGATVTTHTCAAGVGSALPPAAIARAVNVWPPTPTL